MGEIYLEYADLTSTATTLSERGERLSSATITAPVTGIEGATTTAVDILLARAHDLGGQMTTLAEVVTEVRDEVDSVDRSQAPWYLQNGPAPGNELADLLGGPSGDPAEQGGTELPPDNGPNAEGGGHVTGGTDDVVTLPENLTPEHDADQHGTDGAGSGPGQKDQP